MLLNSSTSDDINMSSNSSVETKQQPTVAVGVLKLGIFLLIMGATLVGNSLVCIAVLKFKNLRTNTNLILVSLAVTDLLMVFVMALKAATAFTTDWPFGEKWCEIVASSGLTLSFISILHLCFLSMDRFMAIHAPFRYPLLVTRHRVSFVLPLLWVVPIVALHLPIADITFRGQVYGCSKKIYTPTRSQMFYTFTLVTLFVIVPFVIMLVTHAYVFTIAIRHARQLGRLEQSIRKSRTPEIDSSSSSHKTISVLLESNPLRREIKSAKTFALIVGAFLFCYLPFFAAATYRKYSGRETVSHNVMLVTTWIAFANSFCNPLLYGLRYMSFRNAFKRLCCSCYRNMGNTRQGARGESFSATQRRSLRDGSTIRRLTFDTENSNDIRDRGWSATTRVTVDTTNNSIDNNLVEDGNGSEINQACATATTDDNLNTKAFNEECEVKSSTLDVDGETAEENVGTPEPAHVISDVVASDSALHAHPGQSQCELQTERPTTDASGARVHDTEDPNVLYHSQPAANMKAANEGNSTWSPFESTTSSIINKMKEERVGSGTGIEQNCESSI